MGKPKPPSPARAIVTWAPGDPDRERERWGKDAMTYCRLKRRPAAAVLAKALVPYLHSTDGYAFPSDETLRKDMGCKHDSAVRRAIALAADDLGIITRKTITLAAANGQVTGRSRRIFASRPTDMAEVLEMHRNPRPKPNAETSGNKQVSTKGYATFSVREKSPMPTERRTPTDRTLNRTPSESAKIQDSDSQSEKNTASLVEGGTDQPSAFDQIIEALSWIGPNDRTTEEEVEALLVAARGAWKAIKRGEVTGPEASRIIDHVVDAARRAWIDHRADVVGMINHIRAIAPTPPPERKTA